MNPRRLGDTLTLSYIPSATIEPVITVQSGDSLSHARTLMELHNFSQLPVVSRGNKVPKGVVTWEKIGRALISNPEATLSDCIDHDPPRFPLDHNLLDAIESINTHGYILVTKEQNKLSGIITSADLGQALALIAGPFIHLERLEISLSRTLEKLLNKGHKLESKTARLDPSTTLSVDTVRELTLGEKIELFTNKSTWEHISTEYDRPAIANALREAVELRNRLMHFRELDSAHQQALSILPQTVKLIDHIADRPLVPATN